MISRNSYDRNSSLRAFSVAPIPRKMKRRDRSVSIVVGASEVKRREVFDAPGCALGYTTILLLNSDSVFGLSL